MSTWEHIKSYKKRFRSGKAIATIWDIRDVFNEARDHNITISKEEAKDILETIEDNYNASLGISWNTIEYYLSKYQK